ncbi:MAG: hypothetical protein LBU06_08500 [Desulfovibrio sp.]|jgi:hypothetical protein|nr:hypothetical protein [Desulfovibrio sp.]
MLNAFSVHAQPSCPDSPLSPPGRPGRLLRLCLALGALTFVMYVLAPLAIALLPPLRDYDRVVRETGIMPGALYYSDVPQTVDGEFNNRDAIRFRVRAAEKSR